MSALTVRDFKPVIERGHFIAFLTIETPSGLLIRDCRLFEKNGKRWIGLHSRQYTKSDGTTAYAQIIDFASKPAFTRFQDEAVKGVDALLTSGQEATDVASR